MQPQLNTKGKTQLNRARHPDEEAFVDEHGHEYLDHAPMTETTDPAADRALRLERRKKGRAGKLRRELTQKALALFTSGHSMNEIAAQMGVTTPTITNWFVQHRRAIADGDIDKLLDETAVPLAAENLVHGLLAGDKDYTLETLKGRGKLKRHTEGDGKVTVDLPALVVRFEAPALPAGPDGQPARVIGQMGSIHGTAAQPKAVGDGTVIDADVIEAPEREVVGTSQ